MIALLITLVNVLVQALVLLILVQVVLSYVLSPFHPFRQQVDRLVEPLLTPIRRVIPPVGMFDFSPLVLLILVQIVGNIVKRILVAFY